MNEKEIKFSKTNKQKIRATKNKYISCDRSLFFKNKHISLQENTIAQYLSGIEAPMSQNLLGKKLMASTF